MSNIAIAGDTSGTVTLQAPAIAGTTVLTLPSTSGTIVTTAGGTSGSFTTLTSSADASFATSSGNVGIGTTSPSQKLVIYGSNFTDGAAKFNAQFFDTTSYAQGVGGGIAFGGNYDTGSGGVFANIQGIKENATAGNYASAMLFTTRANGGSLTERMRIDSSGNVGIGTSSPDSKLTLAGYTGGVYNTAFNYQSQYNFIVCGTSGYTMFRKSDGTESMRIDSSGKLVMASTTDGLIGSIQAGITANTASTNAVIIAAATGNGPYPLGARGESTNQGLVGFFNSSNTVIGSVTKSGNNVAYNTSSDYRLKENITPMTGALDKIALLKPVTYTWKSDGSNGQGFIAHELQAIVPDAVTGEKDAVETYTDEEGNEQTRIKPQGIDTSFLVATLTAAIQELKAKVEALEAQIKGAQS